MKRVKFRNEQFKNIVQLKAVYSATGNPIVSMDTKKKEYLGNFHRDGHLYTTEELQVNDHDFSPKAVKIARQAVDQSFAVGDAFEEAPYQFDYNVAVATEVLEHVADDYAIIKSLRKGAVFIFSLPTYDDPAHMRFFPTGQKVIQRYRGYVQFKAVHLINRWFACLGIVR